MTYSHKEKRVLFNIGKAWWSLSLQSLTTKHNEGQKLRQFGFRTSLADIVYPHSFSYITNLLWVSTKPSNNILRIKSYDLDTMAAHSSLPLSNFTKISTIVTATKSSYKSAGPSNNTGYIILYITLQWTVNKTHFQLVILLYSTTI